ncbi:tetratricopeptide repeat-containing diguanylate cyclase [Roseisolibacter agri]|uniref:diguanylate cyclase n=1 Tax=Roseisolibacter agri TaxID=2014610 RepID=A0AA37QAK9_9BACT|nr:tetratricopeptide repeat-containing diguanylate cyclase [Roseisolibacter agri]GLC26131.1 hypothetical protein rosag_26440 [Roseisolibacter agri]
MLAGLLLAIAASGRLAAQPPARDADAATLVREATLAQLEHPARAVELASAALRRPPTEAPARVAGHAALAAAYTAMGRYDSAAAAVAAGRQEAERTGDRAGLATMLTREGALAQRRGDPGRAAALLEDALARQRALRRDSAVAFTLNLLGFVYATDFAEYDRALAYQLESLEIHERIGSDAEALASTLNSLGVIYGRLRQGARAMQLFERALAQYRRVGADARAASTLSNMGDELLAQGDAAGALERHRASLAIRERVGDRWSLSLAHRNLALAQLAMGRPEAAQRELATAMQFGAGTGNRGLTVRNLLAQAAVERARGRPAAAESAARGALAVASAMGARELVRRSWEAIAGAQEADGRPADALASYRQFKAESDSIFDETTSRRIAGLEERRAAERREREIERLWSAQAMSALQARQRATQRNAIAGVALLAGIAGAAAYRRRVRDARRAEALSLTDPLTGARNRRYVREIVARTMEDDRVLQLGDRRRPTGAGGSGPGFLLLDVDHFKCVNDDYGHAAGDRLLTDLARLLERTCGPSDVVVRWGGEEFLVVARCSTSAEVRELADRIRAAVAAHVTRLDDGRALSVTCSLGFALAAAPGDGRPWSWESLVALADHGTYAAKQLGRDAWVGHVAGAGEPPASATMSPALVEAWVADGRLRRETSRDAATPRSAAA